MDETYKITPVNTPLMDHSKRIAELTEAEKRERQLFDRHGVVDGVLDEVWGERHRQYRKWGEQNWPDFPVDPVSGQWANPGWRAWYYTMPDEYTAKWQTEHRFARNDGTFADILVEEVAEAIGAQDEAALREELIQVAAVAVAWVEAIDRRKSK